MYLGVFSAITLKVSLEISVAVRPAIPIETPEISPSKDCLWSSSGIYPEVALTPGADLWISSRIVLLRWFSRISSGSFSSSFFEEFPSEVDLVCWLEHVTISSRTWVRVPLLRNSWIVSSSCGKNEKPWVGRWTSLGLNISLIQKQKFTERFLQELLQKFPRDHSRSLSENFFGIPSRIPLEVAAVIALEVPLGFT